MKIARKPSTALLPAPVVLLSVAGNGKEKPNIITLAWAGTVCSDPPMLSVAIRPTRHSHQLVDAAREFVVNVPRAEQLTEVDLAGMWSGAEHDKFQELGLTATPAGSVAAPLIEECPINIECVVRHQLALGAHDLYIAEIVAVQYDEDVLDARGRVQTSKLSPIAYAEGEYWSLGERIGTYGGAAKASGRR
ncbi:MAG TPA: flavin reductase family protein [Thermoleophilia bacterium]|nr:flavin reductase family protein [Thermoleophilia bacterium]